jgi:N-acetylmuramoyl-L-alanine amidase
MFLPLMVSSPASAAARICVNWISDMTTTPEPTKACSEGGEPVAEYATVHIRWEQPAGATACMVRDLHIVERLGHTPDIAGNNVNLPFSAQPSAVCGDPPSNPPGGPNYVYCDFGWPTFTGHNGIYDLSATIQWTEWTYSFPFPMAVTHTEAANATFVEVQNLQVIDIWPNQRGYFQWNPAQTPKGIDFQCQVRNAQKGHSTLRYEIYDCADNTSPIVTHDVPSFPTPGIHTWRWDGRLPLPNNKKKLAPKGIYLFRISAFIPNGALDGDVDRSTSLQISNVRLEVLAGNNYKLYYNLNRPARVAEMWIFDPSTDVSMVQYGCPTAQGENVQNLPYGNPTRRTPGRMVHLVHAQDTGSTDGTDKWHRDRWALPLGRKMPVTGVVLDPGHGWKGTVWDGASGNGVQEDIVALAYSGVLMGILNDTHPWDAPSGTANRVPGWNAFSPSLYIVRRTRSTDAFVSINERVRLIKSYIRQGYTRMVSLHCNSAASATARRVEVYYCSGNVYGNSLAATETSWLRNQLTTAEAPSVLTKECVESLPRHIGVLRQSSRRPQCPSCLVELGFVSNPTDAAQLIDPAYRQKQSYAIHLGLDAFGP